MDKRKRRNWGKYTCTACGYTYEHIAHAPLREVWHYMCPRRTSSGKGKRLVPMIKVEED